MGTNTFDWKKLSQLSVIQLLLAVFLPSGFAYVGFHVVLPALVEGGLPVMVAWSSVASVMLLIFVIIAVFLLNKDAKTLGISLWTRICMKRLSGREWGLYILIAVVGLFASVAAQSLVLPFMDVFGLSIPAYMPFFLNPAVDPMTADMYRIPRIAPGQKLWSASSSSWGDVVAEHPYRGTVFPRLDASQTLAAWSLELGDKWRRFCLLPHLPILAVSDPAGCKPVFCIHLL